MSDKENGIQIMSDQENGIQIMNDQESVWYMGYNSYT